MSELLPKGEKLRNAVRFLSERGEQAPDRSPAALVEEATLRFDLTPRETEMLAEFWRARGTNADA